MEESLEAFLQEFLEKFLKKSVKESCSDFPGKILAEIPGRFPEGNSDRIPSVLLMVFLESYRNRSGSD